MSRSHSYPDVVDLRDDPSRLPDHTHSPDPRVDTSRDTSTESRSRRTGPRRTREAGLVISTCPKHPDLTGVTGGHEHERVDVTPPPLPGEEVRKPVSGRFVPYFYRSGVGPVLSSRCFTSRHGTCGRRRSRFCTSLPGAHDRLPSDHVSGDSQL